MKFDLKLNQLPLFTLLCGAMGLLLRLWLYSAGMDQEGMLVAGHPAGILVLLLSAMALGLILWFTRNFDCRDKYAQQFPTSPWAAAGSFAAAVALLLTGIWELLRRTAPMALATSLLAILAAAALAFIGLCRMKGLRPNFGFHTLVCLAFVLRLISRYQVWSADPQLHDYCFQLLSTVCAMLFSYHLAALDMKNGSRRPLVIVGLLGCYFSCLSVAASEAPILYAALAFWMATNLGALTPAREASGEEI